MHTERQLKPLDKICTNKRSIGYRKDVQMGLVTAFIFIVPNIKERMAAEEALMKFEFLPNKVEK